MTVKINIDYTVNKFPYINDPYMENYEIHGQGRYNGLYESFRAETRSEALREARSIAEDWEANARAEVEGAVMAGRTLEFDDEGNLI